MTRRFFFWSAALTTMLLPASLALSALPGREHPFTFGSPAIITREPPPASVDFVPLTLRLPEAAAKLQLPDVFVLERRLGLGLGWAPATHALVQIEHNEVTVTARAGRDTVLVFYWPSGSHWPGGRGYLLDGPFRWPDQAESHTLNADFRRTIRGNLPSTPGSNVTLSWLPLSTDGSSWPVCAVVDSRSWECIGVPQDRSGIVLLAGEPSTIYAPVSPQAEASPAIQQVQIRAAAWGRLIQVIPAGAGADSLAGLRVSIRRRRPSGARLDSVRLALEADPTDMVHSLSTSTFWVAGAGSPNGKLLRIEGPGVATQHVPMNDWDQALREVPLYIPVSEALELTGVVLAHDGRPAPRALVMVFERDRERSPVRRGSDHQRVHQRSMAQTVADETGHFVVPNLAHDSYELVAMHPAFGRAVQDVSVDGRAVTLNLERSAEVRGRVTRDGQPVVRASVRILPDLVQLAASRDPLDHATLEGLTDRDGRFSLSLPVRGSSALVVGDQETGIVRVPLSPPREMPPVTDLGAIDLPARIRVGVALEAAPGCDLEATGPLGEAGLSMIRGVQDRIGLRQLRLPEAGRWLLTLVCGARDVPLEPSFLDIPPGMMHTTIRAEPRPGR